MRRLLIIGLLVALGATACGSQDPAVTPPQGQQPTTPTAPTDDPTDDPTGDPTDPVDADCTAAALAGATADFSMLPDEAAALAEFILDAALRCDEQLLATAAAESDTTLTFGEADPYEFFGLPDDGIYATIVTLLTEVPYSAEPDDSTPHTFVWPRVATTEWDHDDQAWQEVVDAGLLTADEADAQREAGAGYLGWRIGLRGDGTWMFLVSGD